MNYWPWWAGALGLAAVTIGHYLLIGTSFGVSGAMERLLFWRQEREVEKADALLETFDFDAALAAASFEAFGGAAAPAANLRQQTAGQDSTVMTLPPQTAMHTPSWSNSPQLSAEMAAIAAMSSPPPATPSEPPAPAAKLSPVASQAVFVAFIFIGGLIASITSGNFKLRTDMGPDYARIVTSDWKMWPILLLGGIFVGFGTRLCGGCSSGHGLNGCSRLQPISILATSVFFGTAVVVSTLLLKVI
jgi:uncharacterized protein